MTNDLDNLIRVLAKLPGLGRRSAERAALALVRHPNGILFDLQKALQDAKDHVCCCDICGAFTSKEQNPCNLCTDPTRDNTIICVVEEPGDILAFHRAGIFNGFYHSLNGKVSASRGTGPTEVRIKSLLTRITADTSEVVLATGTDLEGDATAQLLQEILTASFPHLKITRLAFGLPVDSGIVYSDPVTLKRALNGRA